MSEKKSGRRAATLKVISIQERWEAKKKGDTLPKQPDAAAAGAAAPLDLNPLIGRLNAVRATISTCRHALRKLNVDEFDDIELVLRRHADRELLNIIEQLTDRATEVRHG